MRRITLWALSTITILVLLLTYRTSTSSTPGFSVSAGAHGGVVAANGPDTPNGTGATPGGTSSSSVGRATPASPTSRATSAPRASKSYTGASIDTNYGPVQVQITVMNGKITKAKVTQVPWSGGRDQEINGYAVPVLNKEVVQAQSGTIDMVSGATFTSEGYVQSLQSAIDKAHL